MLIRSIADQAFKKYGQVLQGIDLKDFCEVLKQTPLPEDGFIYSPSDAMLEAHPAYREMQEKVFGGMPMQLGYCNGRNRTLNCLEYHKDSEICVMAYDTILLLGFRGDIEDGVYDTAKVEAFVVPAGTGVELFATTLHYAPCSAVPGAPYQVANGLARGTNGPKPAVNSVVGEDRFLFGCNKWLLAHADASEVKDGACIALNGENWNLDQEYPWEEK